MCAPAVLFHLSAQPGPRLVAVKPQYDPCLSTMRFLMSVHPLTWSKPRTTWSSKKAWGSRAILTAAGRKLQKGRMTVSMLHSYIFCHLFVWKGAAQSDNGLRQVRFSPWRASWRADGVWTGSVIWGGLQTSVCLSYNTATNFVLPARALCLLCLVAVARSLAIRRGTPTTVKILSKGFLQPWCQGETTGLNNNYCVLCLSYESSQKLVDQVLETALRHTWLAFMKFQPLQSIRDAILRGNGFCLVCTWAKQNWLFKCFLDS